MSFIKYFTISSIILSSSLSYAKTAYIPSQLQQFKDTGICIKCDLSEATLPSHDNSNLTGALLVKTDLSHYNAHFNQTNFSGSMLVKANLRWTQASASDFSFANLTGADLQQGNFSSSNFENAILNESKISYANFAGSNITLVQIKSAGFADCAILPNGSIYPKKDGGKCYN